MEISNCYLNELKEASVEKVGNARMDAVVEQLNRFDEEQNTKEDR
jgi:hypothetical protein